MILRERRLSEIRKACWVFVKLVSMTVSHVLLILTGHTSTLGNIGNMETGLTQIDPKSFPDSNSIIISIVCVTTGGF